MTTAPDVLKARLMLLQAENPSLEFEDDRMETEYGDRALIRVFDSSGNLIALEFIEPEELWQDPDAVEEYIETALEGIEVTVIVPTEEKAEAEDALGHDAGGQVRLLGRDEISSSLRYPSSRAAH
mgnify:CR=1 FL=1